MTEFGKRLHQLRLSRRETLTHMASQLGVSAAYLSAVEQGKRNTPIDWPKVIAGQYGLTAEETEALTVAALCSTRSLHLNLDGQPPVKRALATLFVSHFDSMPKEEAARLLALLSTGGEVSD